MEKPAIYIENYEGKNNTPEKYERFKQMGHYRNMNTVWLTPTRGLIPARVIPSWMGLVAGFNCAMVRIFIEKMEVGEAYNAGLVQILTNPFLRDFPYILTVEEDNTPPHDGFLKLLDGIQEYDAVSGLYWTKGEDGVPQIWGEPKSPNTYTPQKPIPNTLQRCNGIGMGFALWRTEMFKDSKFEFGHWFKTVGDKGVMTQDLYFWQKASELGYKCAVDTRVKVGHYDHNSGIIW
jgi:hypothetical protein